MNTTASHARTYKERAAASTDKFAKIASSLFLEKHLSPPVHFSNNCRTDAARHINREERDSFSVLRRRRSAISLCLRTTRSQKTRIAVAAARKSCGVVDWAWSAGEWRLLKRLLPNKSDLQGTALTSYESPSNYIAATPAPRTPRLWASYQQRG